MKINSNSNNDNKNDDNHHTDDYDGLFEPFYVILIKLLVKFI